jgi:hypothetical protein
MILCLGALPLFASTVLSLIIKITLGAFVYVLSLTALWWVSGRSKGIESAILERTREFVRRPARSG